MNCAECGGSHHANGRIACRSRPAWRSPEKLAEDLETIQSYLNTPIFLVGDLRQHSMGYADRFMEEVRERGIDNHVVIELFTPANEDYFRKIDRTFGEWSIEFSPDSHDEKVRHALGKGYDNPSIESTVRAAFGYGCDRFDMFYMTGLPFQDRESALESARASKRLWSLVGKEDRLFIYNAPFAPFVDPGSRAFEDPGRWGYRFFARTLEDHRRLLDSPSWKHVLSYETEWMSRDDIAETSYDAAVELATMEYESGRITKDTLDARTARTEIARGLMHRVDSILKIEDEGERTSRLWENKEEGERLMHSTVCDKSDLSWAAGSIWSNAPRVLSGLLRSMLR